jgi:hypothetical protein
MSADDAVQLFVTGATAGIIAGCIVWFTVWSTVKVIRGFMSIAK